MLHDEPAYLCYFARSVATMYSPAEVGWTWGGRRLGYGVSDLPLARVSRHGTIERRMEPASIPTSTDRVREHFAPVWASDSANPRAAPLPCRFVPRTHRHAGPACLCAARRLTRSKLRCSAHLQNTPKLQCSEHLTHGRIAHLGNAPVGSSARPGSPSPSLWHSGADCSGPGHAATSQAACRWACRLERRVELE
jgi:hypothetical protein